MEKETKEDGLSPIGLGFIGAGFMGQLAHLHSYAGLADCRVLALAEIRPRLRALVAKRYEIPRAYPSHVELLEQESELQGVIAVTRRNMTGPVALNCLNAGLSVLTEKPMASTYEQCKRLVDAAAAQGVVYEVGYNKRHDEGVQEAKRILDELVRTAELGDIIYARAHRYSGTGYCNMQAEIQTDEPYSEALEEWPGAPEWIVDEWKGDYHRYLNTFSHNINLLRYFLGSTPRVDYTSLRGVGGQVVILDFGGFKALVETKNYQDHGWDEVTEIYFENGCLSIETPPQLLQNVPARIKLYKRDEGTVTEIPVAGWTWSFHRQAEGFVRNIRNGEANITNGDDALEDVRLIEDIWKMELGIKPD